MANDSDQIPLFRIDWDESDVDTVSDSIRRGGYWAKGPCIDDFETKLEEYLGVEHALTVNSGTTALVAALEGMDIGDGDEVIVPSFTFIATANAVRLTGAEPVFADIESDTYGLSPDSVRERITESTAAILPVHCYGGGCRITELVEIAAEHDIALLEDAAEVLGAEYNGQKLATFGDAAALSFCQNKIITTGEGGAVVTDDDEIAKAVELYRSHGRASSEYFQSSGSGQYVDIGTNIRMSDMTAALGSSQIERIDELIGNRRDAAHSLNDRFADIEEVQPHSPPADGTHVYQLYTVELDASIDRSHVIDTLQDRNISSKVYWDPPVHQTEYYRNRPGETSSLPVTEDISGRVLSLPIFPGLTDEEIRRIADGVETAIETNPWI